MISFNQAAKGIQLGASIGAGGLPDTGATNPKGKQKASEWALVLEDGSIINITSFMSIDVDSTNKVINSPTETAFATYNKSIGPTLISVNAAYQGSNSERQAITEKLLALSGDMSLLTLITPETVFKNLNVESVTYSLLPRF